MVTLEWKGVEIDYCLACQGVWLDRGELQNIVGDNASELEERLRGKRQTSPKSKSKRLCPRCDGRLVEFIVDTGQGEPLSLDRCPRDHGFWFDGNELETYLRNVVISQSNAERLRSFLKEVFGHE
jgi:Zn-finger nucleic acid-binding protein